ncbi:C2 calcium-dependent membrane targeting [Macleaya cordata]|uniref:C2 calcium-dependent membrane targeting n=1 Tax=Macleaya cordata TaxID=56857 RepID=A0A200QWK1_MACCD|nr:C2 calcium-dependent membrane targeting [Macleaya cordata]
MEYRPLEITVISAKDIKDVNVFSKMDVYVVASIGGDARTRQKTPVDKDGGKNPSWNFPMKFTIDVAAAKQNRLILIFQLKAERTLGDREIGEVHVPIKELLDNLGDGKSNQFVSYQVRKPNGKPKGELNFSYKFGDKVTAPMGAPKGDEPVTAYPAPVGTSAPYPPPGGFPPPGAPGPYPPHAGPYHPPPQTGYPPAMAGYGHPPQGGYPPSQPGYGYPPPQPGYGYPPPQQGYGYPPVQQPPKKNKFGMGLGAGLLGGALGGLLIGDMVSDAADYDGGFDDGGGFDF